MLTLTRPGEGWYDLGMTNTLTFDPNAQAQRIADRYKDLKFEPPAKKPDTSRNRQRATGRKTKRRTIL